MTIGELQEELDNVLKLSALATKKSNVYISLNGKIEKLENFNVYLDEHVILLPKELK